MRRVADLQQNFAHREQAARREVVDAEIKIEIKLITGQRHPVRSPGDELSDPCVHDRYLPKRVRRSIWRARAAAGQPAVPVKPVDVVDDGFGRRVSFADGRAANEQNEPAAVPR